MKRQVCSFLAAVLRSVLAPTVDDDSPQARIDKKTVVAKAILARESEPGASLSSNESRSKQEAVQA